MLSNMESKETLNLEQCIDLNQGKILRYKAIESVKNIMLIRYREFQAHKS